MKRTFVVVVITTALLLLALGGTALTNPATLTQGPPTASTSTTTTGPPTASTSTTTTGPPTASTSTTSTEPPTTTTTENYSMVAGVGSVNVVDGTVRDMPPETGGLGSFNFVCKQANASAVPSGTAQFRFWPGDYPNLTEDYSFSFRSTGYSSLVVDGGKAVCQGTGKVDGRGNFGFRLVAVQGAPGLGGEPDYFRIIIWDKENDDQLLIDTAVWLDDLDGVDAYDSALRSGFVTLR